MFKKIISYLIILSMLCIDAASAMKRTSLSQEDKPPEQQIRSRLLRTKSSSESEENTSPSSSHKELSKRDSAFLSQDEEQGEEEPLLKSFPESLFTQKETSPSPNSFPSSETYLFDNAAHLFDENENTQALSLKSMKSVLEDNDYDEEPELEETLAILKRIENRSSFLKWAQVDHLADKILYALWLRQKDVTGVPSKGVLNSPPLWVEGHGIPLVTGFSTARGMSGFHQGVDYFTKQALSLTLWGLIGYQIYDLQSFQPFQALKIVWEGDKQSMKGILSLFVKPEYSHYFFSLFAAPILWGVGVSGFFARKGLHDTSEDYLEAIKAIEDYSLPKDRGACNGFWKDKLRWFLPFNKIDGEVTYLVYRLLLDGTLSLDERSRGLNALISLTQSTTGLAKIAGLNALQRLAIGTSLKQLNWIEKSFGKDYRDALVREKARALDELRKQNPGFRQAGAGGLLYNLHAHYLRWEMGDFDSTTSALAWAVVKGGTITLTVNFFIKIAQQISDYLKCPKPLEQGFTYAMNPQGYSLYNQKCFDAYLSVFNKVPGQPACTLVNLFPKFKLDPSYTLFNLSGAGATGEQVAELLQGFRQYQPHIHLTQFDLSGNAINTESGMRALFAAFKNITNTNPPERGITFLNLSGNQIGFSDESSTIVLGQELSSLSRLQSLDFSEDWIGAHGDTGTIAIGEALSFLSQLQILDLSTNLIGRKGDDGTIAIGKSLYFLSKLQTLELSHNFIGYRGDTGTIAIGEALKTLPKLQTLDLSGNLIGFNKTDGEIKIGQNLKQLHNLQFLDLSDNKIGFKGDKGIISIGEGLSSLTQLQTLNLSNNLIGYTGDDGTITLANGLSFLINLQTLDLSNNDIISGFSNLVNSITQFKTLESLFIQQTTVIVSSQLALLQQFWNHRNNNTDVYALLTLEDVQTYLNSLLNTTHTINLSRNFPTPSSDALSLLFKGMKRFYNLQTLDLSHNDIGISGVEGAIAIAQGLLPLSQLQNLDLSYNWIGLNADDGTIAIGKALFSLPQLQTLDLSNNQIGREGDDGTIAIGNGLYFLSKLQTLELSHNFIGYRGDTGTIAIGENLQHLPQLQVLDLSTNLIGDKGDNGINAIGKNLHFLPRLQILDLSANLIGFKGDKGIISIGEGLSSLSHLQTLDLSGNRIGGSGAKSLFKNLPQVICNGLETLNLQGNNFTGIPWSQGANAVEGLYSARIQQSCEANRCFGMPVHVNTTAFRCPAQSPDSGFLPLQDECPPVLSSASSLNPPLIFKLFTLFQKNKVPSQLLPPYPEDLTGTEITPYHYIPVPFLEESYFSRVTGKAVSPDLTGLDLPYSPSLSVEKGAASPARLTEGSFASPTNLVASMGLIMVGSTLALKAKDTVSSWFEEEEAGLKPKTKAKSSWAYVYNSFLLLIWLSFMSLFLSDA